MVNFSSLLKFLGQKFEFWWILHQQNVQIVILAIFNEYIVECFVRPKFYNFVVAERAVFKFSDEKACLDFGHCSIIVRC